ncbi:hypothetical protein R1flu_020256 [Riccia fluitans]|uniref:Uncharacterized protein n=1 Tax=Riccia fluitans TaxID=41844 RepID=A0ABD1ZL91_9MARC
MVDYLKEAKVVKSSIDSAAATEVVIASGEYTLYDYLVTGSLFQSPPERATNFELIWIRGNSLVVIEVKDKEDIEVGVCLLKITKDR